MAKRRKVTSLNSPIICRNILVVSSEQWLRRNKKHLSFGATWRCGEVRLCEWATGRVRSALTLPDEPPVGEQMNHTLIMVSLTVMILFCMVMYRCLSWCIVAYQ